VCAAFPFLFFILLFIFLGIFYCLAYGRLKSCFSFFWGPRMLNSVGNGPAHKVVVVVLPENTLHTSRRPQFSLFSPSFPIVRHCERLHVHLARIPRILWSVGRRLNYLITLFDLPHNLMPSFELEAPQTRMPSSSHSG